MPIAFEGDPLPPPPSFEQRKKQALFEIEVEMDQCRQRLEQIYADYRQEDLLNPLIDVEGWVARLAENDHELKMGVQFARAWRNAIEELHSFTEHARLPARWR